MACLLRRGWFVVAAVCVAGMLVGLTRSSVAQTGAAGIDLSHSGLPDIAQQFGKSQPAVAVQPDGLYVCEAEEFQVAPVAAAGAAAAAPGWKAGKFGENYYAATFANSFLSRKAFLGAPDQCEQTVATRQVDIKDAGRFLVLVRYEAAYRFETQFRVQVEQGGRVVLDRLYGARDNLKVWAFSQKLQKEVGWSWGAVENVVWEGHDAFAELKPGRATIRLIAGKQPEPGARRNVDLVMLTTDVDQVKMRIDKESYLPLDGLLTQAGDVWLRVTNLGTQPLTFQGKAAPGGGNWQQHSPYWVHLRNWKSPSVKVDGGKTSDWIEVGSAMDSLADGQWFWTGDGRYKAEFGVKDAAGAIQTIATFTGEGDLSLAGDADTRYSRRLRTLDQVLYDLLDYLRRENPSSHGKTPQRTIIYASTFEALDKGKHAAAVQEFKRLFALNDTHAANANGRGYVDVRSVPTDKLEEFCRNLGDQAKNIAVVSLGDEITLPTPGGADAANGFRQWLQSRGLKPADVDPAAGGDWTKVAYNADPKLMDFAPALYYWSKRYQYHFGIQATKQRTDILRKHLPNASVGANFSPHYPQEHMFLGEVFKWVSVFRDDGMTLPWSEDYIWQVPVATPQLNNINLDLFRAGLRHKPERKIQYYVMPHMPNNTPEQWRRLFFGAVGHGMKIVDLFEFRPVQVAYTENHVDEPAMYRMILGSFRELGLFEDIVQDGQVRGGETGLWFSETADIWGDSLGSRAAAKRSLYTAIRHQQVPLDILVEQDALDGTLDKYKVLYLTDAHVSGAASRKMADWVAKGGRLFATAGAGMFDEVNRPNTVLRALLGVEPERWDAPADRQITWIKQDIPFAKDVDMVATSAAKPDATGTAAPLAFESPLGVYGAVSRVKNNGGQVLATFANGTPAVMTKKTGQGTTWYCGFLPGLSYYKSAIPLRPVDRGSTENAMVHFLPTQFDVRAAAVIGLPTRDLKRPVDCSEPLVESTVIQSPHGVAIPLVNWTGKSIQGLRVRVPADAPTKSAALASGRPLKTETVDGARVFTFDIDAADALILR